MARILSILVAVIALSNLALSLDNGLGLTPAMGYNTWYDLTCSYLMRETTVRAVADALIDLGLAAKGYKYVNLDDCWAAGRTTNGELYADTARFPSGIAQLASYVHGKGLKFGIYTDRGNLTCAGAPASWGHEKQDAQTFANWGVDFLKEDSCNATTDHEAAFYEYGLMRDAMNATGRPIFFDVCGWNDWYAPVGKTLGNEWRIGPDDSNWGKVLENINIDAKLAQYAGPGGWNNPCLLLGTDGFGNRYITELQSRFQFTMWSILAAPLVLSTNVRMLSDYMLDTYGNDEVIAVDQDKLGRQGMRIYGQDLDPDSTNTYATTNVWGRPLADKSWAVAFINVGPVGTTVSCDFTCLSFMGFKPGQNFRIRDLWLHADLGNWNGTTYFAHSVPGQGGATLLKFTPL